MNDEQREIFNEGYNAYYGDLPYHSNPYEGLNAEFWCDGWEDGSDDDYE